MRSRTAITTTRTAVGSVVSSIVERAGNKSRTNKNDSNSNSNSNGRRSSYGRVAGDDHEHNDDEDDDENLQLVEEGMVQHHGVVEDYNQRFTIDDEDYEDEYEEEQNQYQKRRQSSSSSSLTYRSSSSVCSSDSTNSCQPSSTQHLLVGHHPVSHPPQNYICPLTLQLMEDPVNDECGHTFERRAILDWLKTSGNGCCPLSRKPMIMMTMSNSSSDSRNNNVDDYDDEDDDIITSSCSDNNKNTTATATATATTTTATNTMIPMIPMLYSDGHLKARIQEWKMNHPLYQGIDIDYAKHQKDDMLNSNYHSNSNSNYNYNYDYDGMIKYESINDTISQNSNSIQSSAAAGIHTNSRFELMLLPQERNVLNIVKIRARIQKERRDRTRCWYTIICLVILFVIIILITIFAVGIKQIRSLLGI
ncbi:hypothetical protein FRACYDRAFT_269613 [Fragilariopsis cylindrus CCMP1102]|uniref:U-box domain-containing protein n=1 Tax=Fragilariopsis cylindrus CCMP1102 TaxID=635003 RepID=A0A1E7F8V2_9STRA|nr:hypothetical protein FRACYDRAFT_269613 [Fragilariopsis cylindrus CCMP1102]|eukprot:OEU14587.1 hypothetical protein FRACYDRAFT_269613 [Fragilariopsis cylindrus CCMP1102]